MARCLSIWLNFKSNIAMPGTLRLRGLAAPAQPSAGRALHVAFSLILQNSVTQCNRALPRQHENQQTPAPQTVGWLYTYLQQCFQSLQQC
jgi:hypothetical protein